MDKKPQSLREVGGRRLPYEIGSPKYDNDPFRGQRRRPWMCFKVGAATLDFAQEYFMKFVLKVHSCMIEAGILLDDERSVLKYTVIDENYDQLNSEIKDGLTKIKSLYEKGPLSVPIVLLVLDQCDMSELDNTIFEFVEFCHFFKLERGEILQWITEMCYEELDNECVKFAQYLKNTENLIESIAFKFQIEERVYSFGQEAQLPSEQKHAESESCKTHVRKYGLRQHDMNKSPPPGLTPPGLHIPQRPPLESSLKNQGAFQCFNSEDCIVPPPGLFPQAPPGLECRLTAAIPANRSERVHSIELINNMPSSPNSRSIVGEQLEEEDGDHILSFSDVQAAGRSIKHSEERGLPMKNDSNMAKFINGTKLFERFNKPFLEITHNLDLLYVVNYAISSRQEGVREASKTIIRGAFEKKFTMKVKRKFLDGPLVSGRWSDDAVELFYELVHFYFNGARFRKCFMLTIKSFVPSWRDIQESYNNTNINGLRCAGVNDKELRNLQKMMAHVNKWIRVAEDARNAENRIEFEERHGQNPNVYLQVCTEKQRKVSDMRFDEGCSSRSLENCIHSRNLVRRSECADGYERHQEFSRGPADYSLSSRYTREEIDFPINSHYARQDTRTTDNQLGFRNGGGTAHESMERSNEVILHAPEKKEEQHSVTNPEEKQELLHNNNYQPLWEKCELIEPPEDFRTLSTIPTLSEFVNPVEPYIRRIRDDGHYKSCQDYLDVQFRLMKEDLVSPLRDGIDIYKKNGTYNGRRLEGVPCSDVTLISIERVDGKQVTERDGFEMRVIWPSSYDLERLLKNNGEMKELGLVILSCDKFKEDFHLGHIQASCLATTGCLHFAIYEETGNIKTNTTYQLAEGNSYLPSYKHVLENMKKINPFKPIPFERYLVYGKKVIFRPNFQRIEKTEQQIAEENFLKKTYTDIRSQAASRRFMCGKPVPRGLDEEENDDEYQFSKLKDPTPEDMDLEYNQLQEPIFRPVVGVDIKGNDLIIINKKWYHISRLLDEFRPEYLDESQREAFCNTFKNELSLIQGPPGTGKTHLGVQIVKTMLQNRSNWNITEPILVVCFTNSGLDNLLERILQMIEDDEEFSKDNGRPKMIRYGSKCESQYLKCRGILRSDILDQYSSTVSSSAQKERSKAASNKYNKGVNLAISSCTLFSSKSEILSYEIISRVMKPNHKAEIKQFASEHIDSKGKPFNSDVAFACWLLDRELGMPGRKPFKDLKLEGVENESDDENNDFLTVTISDDEHDSRELNDEELLNKLFNKMNLECPKKPGLGNTLTNNADQYHTKGVWEIVQKKQLSLVVLMGKETKHAGNRHLEEQILELIKDVKEMILSAQPLPIEEVEGVTNIFSLARPKRWALYATWCEEVRSMVTESLPKQIQNYRVACEQFQKAQARVETEIMKMPMIIGATTTGCSRIRSNLELVRPRILIVEEAAEVFEAHILSAMISTIEHAVMIGDHKQLRPTPAVHELGVEYGMRISMFERLVERGFPYSQLREQHRMNEVISKCILRPAFYDNVHDAENVLNFPDVKGLATNLYFWSHTERESTNDGMSYFNEHEARMTEALVKHLLKQGYTPDDIVVLTTYTAQREYMRNTFSEIFSTSSKSSFIQVETVDSFQGKERKISLLSLVRSHRGIEENTGIGFLAIANRICVALTRGQHGMYIIGNGAYIMNNSKLWEKIVKNLDRNSLIQYTLPLKCINHGNIVEIRHPRDFGTKSPEGGCARTCSVVKTCGHLCLRPCHPNVESEHLQRCDYDCQKRCQNPQYQHACAKRCYEVCGSCMILVEVRLECGHTVSTTCGRINLAKCDQRCNKIISCGHLCSAGCGVECISSSDCRQMVHVGLECGHSKLVMCGDLASGEIDMACIERCGNLLSCQHQCAQMCGKPCSSKCNEDVSVTLKCSHSQNVICSTYMENNTDGIECQALVNKCLLPCGHHQLIPCNQKPSTENCTKPCGAILDKCKHTCLNDCGICYKTQNHICQQQCEKVLDCGHTCSAKCGEQCPPCKSFCTNSCEHQSCGTGQKGFGRECGKLCALCVSSCFNKCIHRSCTLRCFEVCNVKSCLEPCIKKLKCGHACLGMCGEKCPEICGTCERSKYLKCSTGSNSQRVHRLIMIPKCLHIFPVQILDEHVKAQKEAYEVLKCPKCQAVIVGVLRYAKYTKKRLVDENLKKINLIIDSTQISTFEERIKCTQMAIDAESCAFKNFSSEVDSVQYKFGEYIPKIEKALEKYKRKPDEKWRLHFLWRFGECYLAITKLFASEKRRISRKNNIPPTMLLLLKRCLGNNSPFMKMVEEMSRVNDHVSKNFDSFMIGAVLPKFRLMVAKMTVLQQLSALCHQFIEEKSDISDSDAHFFENTCSKILCANEQQNFKLTLDLIENAIIKLAPNIIQTGQLISWSSLNVPEL